MKRFPIILLLALSPLVATAQFSYVNYAVSGDTAYVASSPDAAGNIAIASSYDGYPVTSIGDDAFVGCSKLTGVTIPDSVTNIGAGAFITCTSLNNLIIPNGVTSIQNVTFWACSSLTNVTIPNSVTSIGQAAFYACTSMTNIVIPNSVTSIGDNAFYDCSKLTSVTIPNSVTNIGYGPFAYCASLTNIDLSAGNPDYRIVNGVLFDMSLDTLIQYPVGAQSGAYNVPNSVTSIGWCAFYACNSLTNVTIPSSVTNIGDDAFGGCFGLINVTIPSSVTYVGNCSFFICPSLSAAYFEGNAPATDGGAGIFADNSSTVYYLPGTTGWGTNYGTAPTALWYQPQPQVLNFEPSFGVQNGQFGFTVSWATNAAVIVQACTNFSNPVWIPLTTNALNAGTNYFSDPNWTNYPSRYYRVSGP